MALTRIRPPLAVLAACSAGSAAEQSEVPDRYKWDLTSLIGGMSLAEGFIGKGAAQPKQAAMREMNRIMDEMERIYVRQAR